MSLKGIQVSRHNACTNIMTEPEKIYSWASSNKNMKMLSLFPCLISHLLANDVFLSQ